MILFEKFGEDYDVVVNKVNVYFEYNFKKLGGKTDEHFHGILENM